MRCQKKPCGGVMLFYAYFNADDPSRKKLLNTEEYGDFAKKLREEYFASDFFREVCGGRSESFDMVSGFMSDVCGGVYRRWYRQADSADKPDLETLSDRTESYHSQ